MKTCTTCGEEKGEDEFYPRAGKYKGTGATMNRCKVCHNAACKKRQQTPEAKATMRRWKAENQERVRELNRKHSKLWREQHPDKWRQIRLRSKRNSVVKH
jgi:hypothetical protein